MDFITDLPSSQSRTTGLAIVSLTKVVHFVPCQNILTAEATAHLFFNHSFKFHGLPR